MARDKTKQITTSIVGVILLVVFGFGIYFIYKNKDTIFGAIDNNSNIYTQEQLDQQKDDAYNQGYNDALTDNVELKKQVEQYLANIAEDKGIISEKEATIARNEEKLAENADTIVGLKADLLAEQQAHTATQERLQAQIDALQTKVDTIPGKDAEIAELNAEVVKLAEELASSNESYENTVANLQQQITSLEFQNATIQNDNANNLAYITQLNADISTLEAQVTNLTNQITANATLVAEYEANKNAWQSSIAYYEQFITALETDTQAVAIFEVNGGVYNAQIVTKGTTAMITNPADTETATFIGWYINDEVVDLATYNLTTNTKFVGKFAYEFNVNFVVDNETYTSTRVSKNACPTELETLPSKEGYEFEGFTINGVDIVDYTTYPITVDTIFIAKFTKIHTITFIANDEVIATQQVKNGEYAQEVNGYNIWVVNGNKIKLSNYPIYADIIFVEYTPLVSLNPVTISKYISDVKDVWQYKNYTFYNSGSDSYIFDNGSNSWIKKVFFNINFYGRHVWEYNEDYYLSDGNKHYILNQTTNEWIEIDLGSKIYGDGVWSNGENIYCSYSVYSQQYIFDKETKTWKKKVFNGLNNPNSLCIWNDGINTYHSNGSSQYILDKETDTWNITNWNGLTSFSGKYIWSDGKDIYYSNGTQQYVLDRGSQTWNIKNWGSDVSFNGDKVFRIGEKIYCIIDTNYYEFY